jgi:hypothetical protein
LEALSDLLCQFAVGIWIKLVAKDEGEAAGSSELFDVGTVPFVDLVVAQGLLLFLSPPFVSFWFPIPIRRHSE